MRTVFAIAQRDPAEALAAWARCCRLPQFVQLVRSITRDRDPIIAAITTGSPTP